MLVITWRHTRHTHTPICAQQACFAVLVVHSPLCNTFFTMAAPFMIQLLGITYLSTFLLVVIPPPNICTSCHTHAAICVTHVTPIPQYM